VRVVIHWHCGWPRECCPCPPDEVTAQKRWRVVQERHRAAVILAQNNEHRRWLVAERERRRAS
jgi:hypothetical protein